jgi:hypothetical protein
MKVYGPGHKAQNCDVIGNREKHEEIFWGTSGNTVSFNPMLW